MSTKVQYSNSGTRTTAKTSSSLKPNKSTTSQKNKEQTSLVNKAVTKQSQSSISNNNKSEKIEVTIIPVDEEPYSKPLVIPALTTSTQQNQQQHLSLKDLFLQKETLWKPVFGNYVQANKLPLFSIFRKKIERKNDSQDIGLHILFLKCDGTKFPRNAYANALEVYCSTYFYGPLVIALGDNNAPYKLHAFSPNLLMELINPLNEEEQRIYPLPFNAKKCSLVRQLMSDERFSMDLDHFERIMTLEEFMLFCYKTSFCPLINQKHEWSECNFAHRQQDFRRAPSLFFYYNEKCSYITDDGSWDACPDQLECQYSHTLVELLFNPLSYKIKECPDRTDESAYTCTKRGELCSHYHSNEERDIVQKILKKVPKDLPQNDSMPHYLQVLEEQKGKKKNHLNSNEKQKRYQEEHKEILGKKKKSFDDGQKWEVQKLEDILNVQLQKQNENTPYNEQTRKLKQSDQTESRERKPLQQYSQSQQLQQVSITQQQDHVLSKSEKKERPNKTRNSNISQPPSKQNISPQQKLESLQQQISISVDEVAKFENSQSQDSRKQTAAEDQEHILEKVRQDYSHEEISEVTSYKSQSNNEAIKVKKNSQLDLVSSLLNKHTNEKYQQKSRFVDLQSPDGSASSSSEYEPIGDFLSQQRHNNGNMNSFGLFEIPETHPPLTAQVSVTLNSILNDNCQYMDIGSIMKQNSIMNPAEVEENNSWHSQKGTEEEDGLSLFSFNFLNDDASNQHSVNGALNNNNQFQQENLNKIMMINGLSMTSSPTLMMTGFDNIRTHNKSFDISQPINSGQWSRF